jgi:DNA-directed RNA polymerase subunit RPC12/RpoP
MQYQLKCPDCGSTVIVEQKEIEGTVQKGGHGTIGVEDAAVCSKCGRTFTQPEIDDWGAWV